MGIFFVCYFFVISSSEYLKFICDVSFNYELISNTNDFYMDSLSSQREKLPKILVMPAYNYRVIGRRGGETRCQNIIIIEIINSSYISGEGLVLFKTHNLKVIN